MEKLHLVFRLQLAELGAEDRRVIAVAEIRRVGSRSHLYIVVGRTLS